MRKRLLAGFLTVVMLLGMLPTTALAAHNSSTGYPTNMADNVVLSLYKGSNFPGEPNTHTDTSGYVSFNANFNQSNSGYANSATNVLNDSIRADLIQGANLNYLGRTYYVWGVFDTASGATGEGLMQYFVNDSGNPIFSDANELNMIKAVKGDNATLDQYEIVWYVIKFQTSDTAWHIDGIVREKNTYSVNYYGNGNTSGGAPLGSSNLAENSKYTILGNTGSGNDGDLQRVIAGVEYRFTGWNTEADGTGTAYAPGAEVTLNEETTNNNTLSLYAQWQAANRYTATVNIYLDGDRKDVEAIHSGVSTLYLSKDDGTTYIQLERDSVGKYTTEVTENGDYALYHEEDSESKVGTYTVPIYNDHGTLDVHHYTVKYDSNDGALTNADNTYGGIYFSGTPVDVITAEPVRNGYEFAGWKDQDGNTYQPGDFLSAVNKPYE